MMFSLREAARLYSMPLLDFERISSGLLVSSGSGIMLSVMDVCPSLRWCLDMDEVRDLERLSEFLILASSVTKVALCGWFNVTKPSVFLRAIPSMRRAPTIYLGNVRAGLDGECQTLAEFIDRINLGSVSYSPSLPSAGMG